MHAGDEVYFTLNTDDVNPFESITANDEMGSAVWPAFLMVTVFVTLPPTGAATWSVVGVSCGTGLNVRLCGPSYPSALSTPQ